MTPADIPTVYRILRQEYARRNAPILALAKARTRDPFRILVAAILSARTKDETTAAAVRRLFRVAGTPAGLARVNRRRLERLIFPVGFYRTKAKHLKQLPVDMRRLFGGRVPDNVDDLCRLPGVGRKVANLVVSDAFGKPAICVDVHVHRICNRFGLLRTRTPLETEMTLRRLLPVRYWLKWNNYLVSHGQTVCRPLAPHCNACRLRPYCARVGLLPK